MFSVEILNPKAKKLLQDLADLRLISFPQKTPDLLFETVKKLRTKKSEMSMEEITKEVEAFRNKRYGQ